MHLKVALAVGSLLLAGSAAAQTPRQPAPAPSPTEALHFLPSKAVIALTERPDGGPKAAKLSEHDNFSIEYATRTDKGNTADAHTHLTHHVHILSGEGTLIYGGVLSNPKDSGGGQLHGDAIVGGLTMALHEGDYFEVPAGMPHTINAAPGSKIRYVNFNTRE